MLERTIERVEQRSWYRSCGLNIVSAVPLDGIAAPGTPTRPDLSIETISAGYADAFAARSEHVVSVGEVGAPWLEVRRGDGGFLARWPGDLDVVIPDDGRHLLVHDRGTIDDSVARVLLCQAMSFVLAAHGLEGLHASAVEIDGRAVVISGRSGAGKSTLASALCRRGGRLLADDLAPITLDADGRPIVQPHSAKTWLMREVAAEMFGPTAGEEHNRIYKVAVGGGGAVEPARAPVPIAAIFMLGFSADEPSISAQVTGKEALGMFLGGLFNFVVRTPQRLGVQFRIGGELVARVPMRQLRWDPSPARADAVADQILALLGADHSDSEDDQGTGGSTMGETTPFVIPSTNGHKGNGNGNGVVPEEGDAEAAPDTGDADAKAAERARVLERLRAAGLSDLPEDNDEPLLRTSQVAALLRSSDRTIRTWADAGKLPYIKTLGGRRLFPASGVLAVLHEMRRDLREEA